MKEADVLFELIRLLDEKEYKFVLEFARGGRSKATQREMLLADLRKQAEYNPQLLRPKYKSFEVLKFQVKQLIMQALRVFHESANLDQRIAVHLQNERILYTKGLYDQAEKELEEAQKLAEQYQKLGRLLEILQIKQFRLVERQTKELHPAVVANFKYIGMTLEAYRGQISAFRTYQELFAAYRAEGRTAVETPIHITLDAQRNHFYRDLYQNAAQSLEAQVSGNLELAVTLAEAAVRLFDSEPDIKDELQLNYKIQLANLGVLLSGVERYAEVEELIRSLRRIESRDFNEEAETFQNTIHLELMLMVNQRQFEGQNNLIQRVEDGLKHYDAKVNMARKLSIWYNLMVLYIVNENFRAAHKVVGMIIEHRNFHVRKEVQYTTRLLELLIYFELELWDLPDHAITAVRQYLWRKEELSEFKLLVLRFMQQLVDAPVSERDEVFKKLDAVLREMQGEETQPDSLGLTVVAAWTRSKYEKRSIKECLQNPAQAV
jgi:tetratricopeptide (TPR) repeat protein